MTQLDKYSIYVKLTVWGESPEDAVSYASEALDASDLLSQDGIVGIELVDDVDSVELIENEDGEYGEDDDED
jgi:hypothetical protein